MISASYNIEALITNSGLIDGGRDFTLNDPNLAYQLPYGVFKNGFKASPLWETLDDPETV